MNASPHLLVLPIFLLGLLVPAVHAEEYNEYREQIILPAPTGCPVQISEVDTFYRLNPKRDVIRTAYSETGETNVGGLDYSIAYANASPAVIAIATEITTIFFDPWGDYVATDSFFAGEELLPGKQGIKKVKYDAAGGEYYFHDYLFVSRVRMADGTVYKADLDAILAQINTEMGSELTLDDLHAPSWQERHARRRDNAIRQAQPIYTRD